MEGLRYPHIVEAVLARPWAIDPTSLAWAALMEVLALRASGQTLTADDIESRLSYAAAQNGPRAAGGRSRNVMVIPVHGTIVPKVGSMQTSGGVTASQIQSAFREAMADPDIDGIVFDVDSPGGVVEGIDELAADIFSARGVKPVAAVANHMTASAAYWAFSGVDELVATPSATVGSIGIFAAHDDFSGALEKAGVKRTIIKSGKFKAEGAMNTSLDEEALAAIQADADTWYSMMVSRIARGRGVGVETVRTDYGEGRGVMAKKALDAGMVDRIGTLDETIRRVARGQVGSRPAGATAQVEGDPMLALAPGVTFAEHVEAVAAACEAMAVEAQHRAAVRDAEGRSLSPALKDRLASAAAALTATVETPEDPEETEQEPEPVISAALLVQLAAVEGGYRI